MKLLAFSPREIKDILISVLALGLVFSYPEFLNQPVFFLVSLLTVGIAFIGHELSHKFIARRRGFFAEFRMWPQGLVLAVLFALATNGSLIFAAPGAVYFAAHWLRGSSRKDVGMIAIAGVTFNLVLFALLIPAYVLTGLEILRFAALINVWLALFNLLPIPPLDGQKVLTWNPKIWALVFIVAGGGMLLLSGLLG